MADTTHPALPGDALDDLLKLAVAAINANDELPEDERDMTPDHILRAVVPEIERRVRDQVATEARVAAAEFRQKPLFRTARPADDAIEAAAYAMQKHHIDPDIQNADGYDHCVCGTWGSDTMSESWDEHLARAAYPEIERQLRERVAAEILAGFGDLDPADEYDQGVTDAAKIVRGGS